MINHPLVSIIIPSYNSSLYVEDAIRSASIEQDYPYTEVIVVDDYSNADTQSRLRELQKKYLFQLIILDKNSGSASKPLNEGIKASNGKYIAICAHDDYYLPNKLKIQVALLENNLNYGMAFCKNYTVYGNEPTRKILKALKHTSGDIFQDLFLQKFYIPALTVILRKTIFNQVGYFDETLLIEDWDMWLRVANVAQIGFVDDYLACFRVHQTNSSTLHAERMKKDRVQIVEKWKSSPHYSSATAINRLIDGNSIQKSWMRLFKDTWIALIKLKQPNRVLSLLLSNIKRKYFSVKKPILTA